MTNAEKYGFKPHDISEEVGGAETEKTVSCKVSPAVWNRWKKAQQRLAGYGEVQLATVVRNSFLLALDELESTADQLDRQENVSRKVVGESA
jgi:hypothetical protein